MDEYSGRSLNVIQCGWQKCDANHSQGPKFYKDYSVTFVLNGKGTYRINNKTHEVKAGEGFIILPGVITYYIADSSDPWEYIYVLFSGDDVPPLLNASDLGADNAHFTYENDWEMRSWLYAMLQASRSSNAFGYDVLGFFYLCMSRIVQRSAAEWQKALPGDVLVNKAVSFMKTHYFVDITVADVARNVGVDRTYLHKLFLKSMGCTPHAWLLNYRLEQGARFLLQTDHSVSEIANSIGFFDASHFSHSFRKKYGCSPLAYKRNAQEEQEAEQETASPREPEGRKNSHASG